MKRKDADVMREQKSGDSYRLEERVYDRYGFSWWNVVGEEGMEKGTGIVM